MTTDNTLRDKIARTLVADRLDHYGFTPEQIEALEDTVDHASYGCIFEGNRWDCHDTSGNSRHQNHDTADKTAEFVMWVLEQPALLPLFEAERAAGVSDGGGMDAGVEAGAIALYPKGHHRNCNINVDPVQADIGCDCYFREYVSEVRIALTAALPHLVQDTTKLLTAFKREHVWRKEAEVERDKALAERDAALAKVASEQWACWDQCHDQLCDDPGSCEEHINPYYAALVNPDAASGEDI